MPWIIAGIPPRTNPLTSRRRRGCFGGCRVVGSFLDDDACWFQGQLAALVVTVAEMGLQAFAHAYAFGALADVGVHA